MRKFWRNVTLFHVYILFMGVYYVMCVVLVAGRQLFWLINLFTRRRAQEPIRNNNNIYHHLYNTEGKNSSFFFLEETRLQKKTQYCEREKVVQRNGSVDLNWHGRLSKCFAATGSFRYTIRHIYTNGICWHSTYLCGIRDFRITCWSSLLNEFRVQFAWI